MPQPTLATRFVRTAHAAAIAALTAWPAHAAAQPTVGTLELLSNTMQREAVTARTISELGVVVLDELDIPRLRSWDHVLLAWRPDAPRAFQEPVAAPSIDLVGWAVLVDGQRHRVRPNPPNSADPEVLEVTLEDGTAWAIPLEALRALVFWEHDAPGPSNDADTVRLANGDALSGFVESIGSAVIVDTTRVPLERVASIELANPADPAADMLVDLIDGSVVAVDTITPTDRGQLALSLVLTGADEETSPVVRTVEPDAILAIRPASQDFSLLPLARVLPERVVPLGSRRWAPPPITEAGRAPAGLRRIELPGPMEVVYAVPTGARSFRAVVELGFGAWAEASFELLAELPGGARVRLDQAQLIREIDTQELRAELPRDAVRLVLRLLEGEQGPVQDRVSLDAAAFVVAR